MPDEMADSPSPLPEDAPSDGAPLNAAPDVGNGERAAEAHGTGSNRVPDTDTVAERGPDPAPLGPEANGGMAEDNGADLGDPYGDPAPMDPQEGAVPPGYDWPTHGGYLGCLLGLIASCLLTGFLGSTLVAVVAGPPLEHLAIDSVVAVVAVVGLGRLGWILGKRHLREYPRPTQPRDPAADIEMVELEGGSGDEWRDVEDPATPTSAAGARAVDADQAG